MTLAIDSKKYTYEDYLKTPEDTRYELIEGELTMTPAPDTDHQDILRNLVIVIEKYVSEKTLGKVFFAPVDVILDEYHVLQPDLIFITTARLDIIKKRGIFAPPDMALEIISPSSYYRDSVQKKELYERFGIKEFWVVDPANKVIEVFVLEGKKYVLYSFKSEEGKINSNAISGFEADLKDIFE